MRWAYLLRLHEPSGMDFFIVVFQDLQANIYSFHFSLESTKEARISSSPTSTRKDSLIVDIFMIIYSNRRTSLKGHSTHILMCLSHMEFGIYIIKWIKVWFKWMCIKLWSLLTRGVKFNLTPICLPKPTQFNNSKLFFFFFGFS